MNTKRLSITLLFSAILTLSLLSPIGASQQYPAVAQCAHECHPQDADVMGSKVAMGDEVTKVILYGHFEDILNIAPLNTQEPSADHEFDLNGKFLMPIVDTETKACTPSPAPEVCPDFHFKNNEFTMESSPGLVEYLSDGSWRTHQEPGLAGDAKIADKQFNLYFYLSSYAIPNYDSTHGPTTAVKAGVMPQVAIYARMESGRFKFKGADLLAVSADGTDGDNAPNGKGRVNLITNPATGEEVYEFQTPMIVKNNVISSSSDKAGFIVYVNPYQVKYATSGDYNNQGSVQVGQEEWRLRTGPKFPPRIVIPIQNVMQTKVNPLNPSGLSIFEDRLFVRWSFISVWGSYDIKDQSLKFEVTKGKIDPKALEFIILKRSVDHDGHFKPVNATWAIDFTNYPLDDGAYQFTTSINNRQGTYMLMQTFDFTVEHGKPIVTQIGANGAGAAGGAAGSAQSAGSAKKSFIPGFEGAFLAAAVVAALVVAGRRRKA